MSSAVSAWRTLDQPADANEVPHALYRLNSSRTSAYSLPVTRGHFMRARACARARGGFATRNPGLCRTRPEPDENPTDTTLELLYYYYRYYSITTTELL